MLRAIGSWIVLNVFLASCRGWFFRTTLWQTHHRWWLLGISCISSWLLASFPFLAAVTGQDILLYTNLWPEVSVLSRSILILAIVALPTIVYFLVRKLPTAVTVKIVIQFVLLGAGLLLAFSLTPWAGVASRALIALIEERTKTTTSLAYTDAFSFLPSDIIFFWLMSALWFACIENFVYLRNLWVSSVGDVFGLLIKRMLTSRILHMSYTGLIAIGITYLTASTKKHLLGIGLIWAGILLHTWFNNFLSSAHIGITLLIIMFWYFFMSRLVYKSERVYI